MLSLLAWLVARVGYARLRALAWPLVLALGWVRRRHVALSMRRANVASPERSAKRMAYSLAVGILELLWIAGKQREPRALVRFAPGSREQLEAAVARGQGVVLAASHTGNWELAACALAAEVPLTVIAKRMGMRGFDRFARRVRASYGVELLDGRGTLAEARARLRRGEVVAALIDQVPERTDHGVLGAFLGGPVLVDRCAAALARATGAPLVVTASTRDTDGLHTLHVLSVLTPPDQGEPAWVQRATLAASNALERFVADHPDQWLWLHRRWRSPRGTAERTACPITSRPLPRSSWKTLSSSPESRSRAA